MPRTAFPLTVIDNDGVLLSGGAPDSVNGNDFQNNGRQFVVVQNNDAAPHTMTIEAYPQGSSPDGLTFVDKAVVIAAGAKKVIGPFPPSIYGAASNRVNLDWDAITGLSVQVFSFSADPG